MAEMSARAYTVNGMTCEHCSALVDEEVSAVAGVENVVVDLTHGLVEVRGSGFDDHAIRSAVEAAGYQLDETR